jgi:tetratricopeptide (TPR) repeat protein
VALDVARELHALRPTPETLALRKKTVADAAGHFADRDRAADFNRVMAEAEALDPTDPAWTAERAGLLARGGRLAEALTLVDDAARPKVLGHAADRAVRHQTRAFLPDDLHAGFDAVLAAFRHHEAGNEAAARDALEPIGLRSPFLEWKVLLRGLLAHAAADDARAAENFGRLDPTRLPARLAAPYRVALDPAFKASLPAGTAGALLERYQKLTTGPVIDLLRAIAKDLGRDKPLAPAFRSAEAALPHLRQAAPHLVPRLANCLYHAIIRQGQPDDLPRYRRLFGDPPDDPHFHKLQALVGEQVGNPESVHSHWQKFEAWLADHPAGWPEPLATRARAVVWVRMGENARTAAEQPDDDPSLGFFAPPTRRKKPKPLTPPGEACFEQAATLAPDWPDATRHLFEALVEAKKPADAEAAARAFLARHPADLPALSALAGLLQTQGRSEEACDLWLRVLAVNPLDKPTRFRAASAVLSAARRKLMQGNVPAADALLDQHRPFLEEQMPAGVAALRSVILTKLGKPDEAAALCNAALAVPGARLGAAYRIMVDAQLAKLKPADKRAADRRFADELAQPPTPLEVNQLVAVYDVYHIDAFTYRGQKTHEKKVLDQVARCLTADAPEIDFERLGQVLLAKHEWKRAKQLADACASRFPANPFFVLARAEAGLGTGEREYHVERRVRRAKQLAEAAAEPRHRALLGRIDDLLKQVAMPFDFLDAFFNGSRG